MGNNKSKNSKNNDDIIENENKDIIENENKDIIEIDTNSNKLCISIPYKKNHKNLICDDASANRLVLKKYLIYFGCVVDEAENGQDAIDKIKNNGEYSIIWMDIKMPKMDGIECVKHLRTTMEYKGTIIGLTGYVDDITIKKCINIGMNAVIAKPFDKRTIQTYIEENKTNSFPITTPRITYPY